MSTSEAAESAQVDAGHTTDNSRGRLNDLIERAAAKDAVKDFNAAAELYSEATELQATLNGEMSPRNADLLFSYGKAVYSVAVSKSDVLGSKVAGEPQTSSASKSEQKIVSSGPSLQENNLVRSAIASSAKQSTTIEDTANVETGNKAYFQFTGDENYDDSESDEGDEKGDGGADSDDDDDDDFANAFEVLDLARILYHKQLATSEEAVGKGKSSVESPSVKHVKSRLADTYDLQAEISLEAERFSDAVSDLKTALELRQSLFPIEDPSIAECHYKLSLALEFESANNENVKVGDDDYQGREMTRAEAAVQMEKAIESCQVRMAQEEQKLQTSDSLDEDKATAIKRQIANVKDIINDMEQRLIDLRRLPAPLGDPNEKDEAMLRGILGQMMGQTPSEQQAKLDAVAKDANDLSSLVKRKQPNSQALPKESSTHKRPAPEDSQEDISKRTRMGDTV